MLQEGGRVVPYGATVWAQVVESPFLEKLAVSFMVIDKSRTCLRISKAPRSCCYRQAVGQRDAGTVHGSEAFLKPLHVDPLYPGELQPLSAPFWVFKFDFARPPQEGQHATNVQVWQASKQESCGCELIACLLAGTGSFVALVSIAWLGSGTRC